MSNKRLLRGYRESNNRELAELKKEVETLKRQAARLRKENEKLRGEGEMPEVSPKPLRHRTKKCPRCGKGNFATFTAPSGKVLTGCRNCKLGNEGAVKKDV